MNKIFKFNMAIKNIFKRIIIVGKKGLQTPTLPANILLITNYPLIRIIRFLGGVSFLMIVTQRISNFPIYVLYINVFFSFLLTIYHIILTYFRIKYVKNNLFSDKLEVKKSPLDR